MLLGQTKLGKKDRKKVVDKTGGAWYYNKAAQNDGTCTKALHGAGQQDWTLKSKQ